MPAHHSVDNFAQAIRAIGEPIRNRTAEEISMAKLLTLVVRGHRPVRHADAAGIAAVAKDDGGGRRRRARFDPELDMWKTAEPWCANGSSAILARWAGSRARSGAGEMAGCWPAAVILSRAVAILERLDEHDPGWPGAVARNGRGDWPRRGRKNRGARPRSGSSPRLIGIWLSVRRNVIAMHIIL